MEVLTRDGEVFPVKRRLLRPCIALTQAVRSEAPSVAVDVDTLVFDRCAAAPTGPVTAISHEHSQSHGAVVTSQLCLLAVVFLSSS